MLLFIYIYPDAQCMPQQIFKAIFRCLFDSQRLYREESTIVSTNCHGNVLSIQLKIIDLFLEFIYQHQEYLHIQQTLSSQ